ncbi:acetyl-CoA carboxylase biotin carboxylase subunit [candidate division TA06 bacterium]|uniref:Acetyl-CoA carboxylase biotin carboxylase subunit n=1 Tax=candidate division TA06 bacterium TaxID=2250710 RepID=A0A523UWC8_UNCT6|nr:MAG: acetyl-CoA carboxylase biotin carboxylase subunit [candidate division TA06 bacterium]
MLGKILISNRGEIAVRIIRACRELGIPAVAVYSDCDRNSSHVYMADEAVHIGLSAPLKSYLDMDRVIKVAMEVGADAIHPGYGFLAENPLFAKRCEDAGLVFIGPSPKALALVGDKLKSRQTMVQAQIPIIPGMREEGDPEKIIEESEKLGFPVLIKASAGGGGKGMRVARNRAELKDAIEAGMREAQTAFGNPSVYIEKYLTRPRHIEFQILADQHGNAVHLFERECSIQRRHQKIVEESPSVALDPELREKMGATAIKAIRASNYTNAGTVEFLVDEDRKDSFYFLEVNARVQVEHPVTELVTGIDIVKQQILIASGEKLPFTQPDISQRGHAIECRVYAEDPERSFLPSPGRIAFLKEPFGPGVRHDCGIYSGWEVPVHYDPILSKVITWGEDRETARIRMINALSEYVLLGIKTTIEFSRALLSHKNFIAGDTHTDFIEKNMSGWCSSSGNSDSVKVALIAAAIAASRDKKPAASHSVRRREAPSPWLTLGEWELFGGR